MKKAAPLLLNVSFLIGFFWLLFAIIGVQSFKSSFDRQCVWVDPNDPRNKTGSAYTNVYQFCGGQFNNETGAHDPYQIGTLGNLSDGAASAKGFLCPRGSYCLQLARDQLPYNGTVSFDNIFQSLELVFVIMTGNTYTDLMYYTMNSDYLVAALFFAGATIIMMFWLLNLLIAVITSSSRSSEKRVGPALSRLTPRACYPVRILIYRKRSAGWNVSSIRPIGSGSSSLPTTYCARHSGAQACLPLKANSSTTRKLW